MLTPHPPIRCGAERDLQTREVGLQTLLSLPETPEHQNDNAYCPPVTMALPPRNNSNAARCVAGS